MFNTKRVGLLFMSVVFLLVCACATNFASNESVCAKIPDGQTSVICQISEKVNVTPEAVSGVLKIANLAGVASKTYTVSQALAFIDRMEIILKDVQISGITYADFVIFITKEYNALPPEVQALFVILEDFKLIDIPEIQLVKLTDYDFGMISRHFAAQRKVLMPFLVLSYLPQDFIRIFI